MAIRADHHPLDDAYAALLEHGLDGAGEALRILVNEASKIERGQFLNAKPHERTPVRTDYANDFKPKTVMTRVGKLTFDVPQVRGDGGRQSIRRVHLRHQGDFLSRRKSLLHPSRPNSSVSSEIE